jgi:N6-adenosine-specific RNA methylase IME4
MTIASDETAATSGVSSGMQACRLPETVTHRRSDPFGVVVADPPWRFTDRLSMSATRRGAAAHYATMSVAELVALPVANIVAPNAVLALWTPAALQRDGLAVLAAWGFASKGVYIWTKSTKNGRGLAFGMGHLFRGCAEIALIGNRGSTPPTSRRERNVSLSPALRHSKKPEHLQDSLDRMFPDAQKLEIFARRARPGWTCIGNEAPSTPGEDIRDSLRSLASGAVP